jgi:Uma2 family endonuclease
VVQSAARPRATYADVLNAPENMRAEVLDGQLYLQPRPRHVRVASSLGAALHGAFDTSTSGPGGWVTLNAPELHLGPDPDILVPDLAGWHEESYPGDQEGAEPFYTVAPQWACEVLSPGTARTDRMKKIPIYAREGISHVWLVDPAEQSVEVLRLARTTYELVGTWGGEDEPFAVPPFEAVSFPPAAFWGKKLPSRERR